MAEEPAGPGKPAPGAATVAARASNASAFLQGGGELGALIRAKDWSRTPLGPSESWPQSLKTTLGILLNSRYPMFVFWGPELIKIYNDAYRPITGHKHPWALGRPGREVWPEIWSDIEPLVGPRPRRRSDLVRRPDALHGAQRVPRGGLLHVLLQPDPRRVGRRRRHVLRLHRDDGARDRRAAPADAARPRRRARRRADRGRRAACDRPTCCRRARPTSRSR